MIVLSISLLFSDWGISLFNLPDIILASRSVSNTDSGYIVRVRKHTHTRTFLTHRFLIYPWVIFCQRKQFLSPGTAALTYPVPKPTARPTACRIRLHERARPADLKRGIHKEAGRPLREAHFHFKHVLLQRNSQEKDQDPMSIGALFGWPWSSSNSHRIYGKDIIRWEVYFY